MRTIKTVSDLNRLRADISNAKTWLKNISAAITICDADVANKKKDYRVSDDLRARLPEGGDVDIWYAINTSEELMGEFLRAIDGALACTPVQWPPSAKPDSANDTEANT